MPAPLQGDLIERISYLSSASKTKEEGGYVGAKSPDLEGGALRPGGRPNIWGREYIGLLIQYAAIGVVYGTLPSTVYPVLQNYLNMEGTQIVSAKVLLTLPWSFKVLYGIITDCFPIFGYRRRPYIIIGWALCALMLLIMACSKIGKPYYLNPELRHKPVANFTAEDWATGINKSAPDHGGKFIVLMMLAAVGYVGADVACDATMVELAQREPEPVRGTTQTTIYLVRTIFVALSDMLTGFFFNGEDYGGDFHFSLSFPQLMLILLLATLPAFPAGWFLLHEEKHPGVGFRDYIAELWELLQSRAMYRVVAYKFFSGVFENMTQTVSTPIETYWAKATPLNDTIATVVSQLLFAAILFVTAKWGLGWHWVDARRAHRRAHGHRRLHDHAHDLGRRALAVVLARAAAARAAAVRHQLDGRHVRGRRARERRQRGRRLRAHLDVHQPLEHVREHHHQEHRLALRRRLGVDQGRHAPRAPASHVRLPHRLRHQPARTALAAAAAFAEERSPGTQGPRRQEPFHGRRHGRVHRVRARLGRHGQHHEHLPEHELSPHRRRHGLLESRRVERVRDEKK